MTDCSAEKAKRNLRPITLKRGDSGYLSPVAGGSALGHLTPSRNHSSPQLGDGSSPCRSRSGPTIAPRGTEAMQDNGTVGPGSSLALDDIDSGAALDMNNIQLAFKCREDSNQAWKNCKHSYCQKVRTIWNHWSNCYDGANVCAICRDFEDLSCRHSGCPGESSCLIPSCRSGKKRLGQAKHSACNNLGGVGCSDSLGSMVSKSGPLPSPSQKLIGKLTHYPDDLYHELIIGEMAEKIVKRLDEEKPLLPENYNSMPNISVPIGQERPHSSLVPDVDTPHYQLTSLYSIVERSEDSLSPPYSNPRSLYNSAFHSHSSGPMSSEMDSLMVGNVSMNGMPSTSTNSLGGEQDGMTIYPHQTVTYDFNKDTLTLGSDAHYYQRRDYNANDTPLGIGGFGSILYCKDLTSNQLFAVKHNNREDQSNFDSIDTEARLLSRLALHNNVIQMYGAVIDEQKSEFQPTKMYKMMMELAEHGNLSSMLVDPDSNEPFPLCRDQALYYFWQLLEGVRFLHDNYVLHLDIKGLNLLVFDQGKTLKLCDFGTAIRIDDASYVRKSLCTPQFAAPEICKEEEPRFSSDLWSCMCVLVEMLTASKPWQRMVRTDTKQASIIFMVGSYKDEDMEKSLIPCVETEPIDPDLLDMMRLVFKADHTQRSTALELLQHPLVIDAYKYESEFDEANNCEDDVPDETEPPSPLPIPASGPIPDSDDFFIQNSKRISKDSGSSTSIDLEAETCQSSYGRTASDSGVDSPCTDKNKYPFVACPEGSSKNISTTNSRAGVSDDPATHHSQHHYHILSSSPNFIGRSFFSLPNPVSSRSEHIIPVQRSFSITSPGSLTTSSIYSSSPPCGSNHGNLIMMHQCSCSTLTTYPSLCTVLKHSNSAPAFGSNHRRRRLSLQTMKSYRCDSGICEGEMRTDGRLRRSSSEVYAVKGPDIDSPKGINKSLGEEVATDHDQAQKEVSTQVEPTEEKQSLELSRETDHLMAAKPQPAADPTTTTGTPLTSFKDTPISSEASSIPSESSCSSFEATHTPTEVAPVNQGTPLGADNHGSVPVAEHVQEASGRDSNPVEGVNGKFKNVSKENKNTLYEHLL